jgi:hypothetical protein
MYRRWYREWREREKERERVQTEYADKEGAKKNSIEVQALKLIHFFIYKLQRSSYTNTKMRTFPAQCKISLI